jgi:GT2 family glycosyltransferase
MQHSAYEITAVVLNYNGGESLLETIRSLRAQPHVNLRVIVVDDGSTDNSVELVEQSGLVDQVLGVQVNSKHANRLRAMGMEAATTDLVLVTDNDVEFSGECLGTLASTFDQDPLIAAVTPAIYDSNKRNVPYSLGSLNHFLGLTIRISDTGERIVDSVGTGITMYSKSRLGDIGFYDPAMPMGWGADGEFHQRIRLAGLRSVVNREATIFHDFKPFSKQRTYRVQGATHNRLRLIATHYATGTIIGLLPLLIAYEIFLLVFYSFSGLGRQYLSGVSMFLGSTRDVLRRRSFIKSIRRRPDRELLFADEVFIPAHVRACHGPLLYVIRSANAILAAYWSMLVWLSRR